MFSGFVDVSLSTSGGPCADDAIASPSLDVYNVEDAIAQRGSNNDHTVGFGAVVKVDSGWVSEDGGCFGEGNTVLVEVRLGFFFVPLEIAFDDCSHGILEYGPCPIFGQAR
jgi:hypothetical protein